MTPSPRLSRVSAVATVVVWLLTVSAPALALNPALDISQYVHTAFRIRDGFTKSVIHAIAQTPDGYLWLGTDLGLLRFDGVRTVPWSSSTAQRLPDNRITCLRTATDGSLWIGTQSGLGRLKDGGLTSYSELTGQSVSSIVEDREGVIWIALGIPTGRLCSIRGSHVQCDGQDGGLGRGVLGLYLDSSGGLWASVFDGMWRWRPGPPTFIPLPGAADASQFFAEDAGRLLISSRNGVLILVDGKPKAYPLPGWKQPFKPGRLLPDRDGMLWISNRGHGLLHVRQPRTDAFGPADGLSGDNVQAMFEDREGNLWVATNGGLDRFREPAATTFSAPQGLPGMVLSVLPTQDGSVWAATSEGLKRLSPGSVVAQTLPIPSGANASSLFQDAESRVWLSGLDGFGYLEDDRFVTVSRHPGTLVQAIAGGLGGAVWLADQNLGLVEVLRGSIVRNTPWTRFGHKDFAMALAGDRGSGGIWVGFYRGGVEHVVDGTVRASYDTSNGLGAGRVFQLTARNDGSVWAATEGGLSYIKDGPARTLTSRAGLPCDAVHWMIEGDQSFWVFTACGLARISRDQLEAWQHDPMHTVQPTVFDDTDGVTSDPSPGGSSPRVAMSRDGKLWFVVTNGLALFDRRHVPVNRAAPPVYIEQVTADGTPHEVAIGTNQPLHLAPLTRDVQIDYTALSLVAPEKMRFKYWLEGYDREWHDVTRRQAFYENLKPRSYRFHVIASNNSGVWNETGAYLDFSVDPAYYQTTWFAGAVIGTALLLIAGLYRLRVRQVAQRYNLRLEERVNERTRIARDLHDTLLQSFHAVVLRFRAATYLLPDRPEEAKATFDGVIDDASKAIVDARNAVQGLRASSDPKTTLVDAIAALAKELEAETDGPSRPQFILHVEGTPGGLQPLVRDDVYRIAREALRNAFRHASAARIEVDVRYDKRQFRLRIRDDGKGIDDAVAAVGSRPGHFGLAGMRERAELVKGTLTVWTERGAGTEIELAIPASIAYAKASSPRGGEET